MQSLAFKHTRHIMKSRFECSEIVSLPTNLILAGSMLLASSAVFISLFASTTLATPIQSHSSPDVSLKAPLVARQKGTYSGTDALNASLAGTFNCYKGGTWALQDALDVSINQVCGAPVYQVLDFTPFSLVPNADGAYPPQQSDYQLAQVCFDVSANCDSTPVKGKGYIQYTGDIQGATHANTADCEYAMGRVRDICHGKNGWTRGGWYTFSDGTTYGLDPSRNGESQ